MTSIDVVITTYNRHGPLNRCLAALAGQTQAPSRVIVVDDCSDPPVELTISRALRAALPLTIVRQDANGGPARGRNAGVQDSSAETVLFVDDDVVATPRLLEHHQRWHQQSSALVVIGPLVAPPDWQPTAWNLWEARKLDNEYQKMEAGLYSPTWRQFFTGNASVHRSRFLRAGGFNEHFTRAEDIELGIRLEQDGCRFVFEPRAAGLHYAIRTAASWLRIPGEYARFDVAIDQLHPGLRWAHYVQREARLRHPLTRAVTVGLRTVSGERPGARAALAVASGLHSIGMRSVSQSALSLAFALEYSAAFRSAMKRAERISGSGEVVAESGAGQR